MATIETESRPVSGNKSSLGRILPISGTYLVLLVLASLYVFVFVWTLYSSLKTNPELFANVWSLPSVPQWKNYRVVMTTGNMLQYFYNSLKYTVIIVVARVILSAMAAYVLARFEFRLATPILYYFLSALMVPSMLTTVPCFILMKNLGLLGTQWAYIILAITGLPFNIFVLIGFFKGLPQELADAAYIDGCGEFTVFWRIMLPMARPGLLTVAVISIIGVWNDFMGPLIFIRSKAHYPLATAVYFLKITMQYNADWVAMLASVVILMVPALTMFVMFQDQVMKGLNLGEALKH